MFGFSFCNFNFRGFNLFGAFRLKTPGLVALLSGILFVCGLGLIPCQAWAARAHHHPRHRTRAVHHPIRHSVRRHRRVAARHTRRRADRASETEPQIPRSRSEIAQLPLEHYRNLPPLLGSHESLLRQNQRASKEGLAPIQDRQALLALSRSKKLVAVPVNGQLSIDRRLEPNRRYCRPWTARFLVDFAAAHYARFHSTLKVNSAVRTVDYQRRLLRINGNAAPAEGDTASPHLTGEAVDIAKKGLSRSEIGWMRAYLLPLQSAGKIDVEEEFQQACFHISVYKSYIPKQSVRPSYAAKTPPRLRHRHSTAVLAARLP